jgi:hypothetical protein
LRGRTAKQESSRRAWKMNVRNMRKERRGKDAFQMVEGDITGWIPTRS